MTYKVRLSKKNQGSIPVDLLRQIGLTPNQENNLIIYVNLEGDCIITTPAQMVQKLAGSLGKKLSEEVKVKLSKMTHDEILDAEKNAVGEYFKEKWKKNNGV